MHQQFRFASEGQSRSSPLLAERSPACKHELCRFASNAVVMSLAAGSDDLHQRRDLRHAGRPRVVEIVPGGSDVGDVVNASFLGIAEEPVLAGVDRFKTPQASGRLPFALPKEEWSTAATQRRRLGPDALLLRE